MNFLLMSNDVVFISKMIEEIKKEEEGALILTTDFQEESLLNIRPSLENISLCVIYSDPTIFKSVEESTLLASIVGYLYASNTPVITNDRALAYHTLFTNDSVQFLKDQAKIISYLKKQYSSIISKNDKRMAKKELMVRGIPFTADCFAQYMSKNKTEICNLFLEADIDPNSRDDFGTPLLNIAVRNDNLDFVKKLLDAGAKINEASEDRGYTPVMDAVWRGNYDITKFLIEKGAELNTISKEGQSNLVLAVGADRTKICEILAQNGADPDIKDQMGMSAYGYATLFKKTELVEILKPYHKDV
ncbi:MAG: ankyrin repeat domain-containing protein [Treponema sp.]|nr:ankyrin repeat domain-containing protein [Treponema sp.]